MASEAKIKLTLDGEKEFKSALSSINTQTKALNAEMKAVTSSFDKNTSAQEKNEKTTELLSRTQRSYQKQIDLLKERIEKATEAYGENSDYVNKLKAQLYNAQAQMNNTAKAVKGIAEETDKASDSTLTFGDVLGANLLSGVLQKGLETIASKFMDMAKAVIEFGLNVASLADDLNTLARQTGLSTDTLQEFQYASAFIDVEVSTMTGSLTKLTKNMYSASTGSKSASDAFSKLGVNIYNADGSLRDSYDVFLDTIDALGQINDEATRDGLAMSIFGKSAQELNPLIIAGSGALAEYRQQAHEVGYVMDGETLDAMNSVNDEVDAMKLQFEALKNQLGVDVSPVIHEVIVALKDFVDAVDWQTVGQVIYTALMFIVGAFETAYYMVKTVIDIFTWLGEIFEALPEKVASMSDAVSTKIAEMKDAVANKFKELKDNALKWGKDMVQGFIDGIQAKIDAFRTKVASLADIVRSFLHFSRPDEGPLRDYEKWMPDMVQGLADSLSASSWKLENAVGSLAGGMAAGMTMNLGGITINGVADESQIDRMVNTIERKLGQRLYR